MYLKIPHHDFEMLLMFDAEVINIKATVVEKGKKIKFNKYNTVYMMYYNKNYAKYAGRYGGSA